MSLLTIDSSFQRTACYVVLNATQPNFPRGVHMGDGILQCDSSIRKQCHFQRLEMTLLSGQGCLSHPYIHQETRQQKIVHTEPPVCSKALLPFTLSLLTLEA